MRTLKEKLAIKEELDIKDYETLVELTIYKHSMPNDMTLAVADVEDKLYAFEIDNNSGEPVYSFCPYEVMFVEKDGQVYMIRKIEKE